jgi:hypothetical protein
MIDPSARLLAPHAHLSGNRDLYRLAIYLVSLPAGAPSSHASPAVCMNQEAICEDCIFRNGHLAKWCPPAERQAKAELDSVQQSLSEEVAA